MSGNNAGVTEGRTAGEGLQGPRALGHPRPRKPRMSMPALQSPECCHWEPHPTPMAPLTPSPWDWCLSAQQSPHILQLPGTQGSVITDAVTTPSYIHPS